MYIQDFTPSVVEEMLRYIYTGNAPNIVETADQLLIAAEKYQLDDLKNLCEQELSNNIKIENAIDRFIQGDMYQAQGLKEACLSFLVRNWSAVSKTKDWEDKMRSKPDLLTEVLKKLAWVFMF